MLDNTVLCEDCKRTFVDQRTFDLHKLFLGDGDFFRCATAEELKYMFGFANVAARTSSTKVYARVVLDQGAYRPIRDGEDVQYPYRKAGYRLIP